MGLRVGGRVGVAAGAGDGSKVGAMVMFAKVGASVAFASLVEVGASVSLDWQITSTAKSRIAPSWWTLMFRQRSRFPICGQAPDEAQL